MNSVFKLLLIFFFGIGCGTEIGNPIADNLDNDIEDEPTYDSPGNDDTSSIYTRDIKTVICEKLIECYGGSFTLSNCSSIVGAQNGFNEAFSLSPSSYTSYDSIITAEEDGEFIKNALSGETCKEDVSSLTCNDSEVINAFDTSDNTNYTNLYEIIPVGSGSCSDFLTEI